MCTSRAMSNFYFGRCILQSDKHVRNILKIQRQNATRTITVAATAEKHEDPLLANAKPFEDMPSLPMVPFLGSSWAYFPIIGKYRTDKIHIADREKYKKYGNIVRERFGHLNVVSSFVPETMEVMYRHEGKYPSRGEFMALKAYREMRKDWYKSLGVIILQGKEWYDLRSKTQKHLMKPRAIQAYLEPMQEVARDFVSLVHLRRDANKEVPQLMDQLYKWALESVAFVGLDTRLDCLNINLPMESDGRKMIHAVQTTFECLNKIEPVAGNFPFWKYFPSPTWKKFEKAADVFTQIAFKYINQSLDKLKTKDLDDSDLTLLQSMLLEKGLDVSGAMVTVADMLMAGIDTTSHTIGFFLYRIAKNPDKQELLFKEINQLLPRKEDRITPEIFSKFHYLKACLKESIRMDPIVRGNARSFDHDVAIQGYRVPAGTAVLCLHQVIYRDEKYFKNADKFLPERWLEKDQKVSNPYAYVPFGIGTRSCLGRRLAELEMISLITEILRNFAVEYHHEDIDMNTRLVNTPDRPLRISLLDR